MKKVVYAGILTSLLLAGCGNETQTVSTSDSKTEAKAGEEVKVKKKLDREEQLAVDFYEKLVLGTTEEKKAYFDEYVHTDGKLFYSSYLESEEDPAESQVIGVVESFEKKNDEGLEIKPVLVLVKNSKDELRETIVVFAKENDEYKLMISSTSDQDLETELGEVYKTIRPEFKSKVPKQITERQEKEAKQMAKVEVSQQVLHSWKNSIGTVWVHFGAEIKNTGDAPAEIGSIQVNYKGVDGSIVGTSDMVTADPDVLMPGETAYIAESTTMEGVTSEEDIKDATLNIDFSKTDVEPMLLETENVNFKEVKDGFSNPYIVTGTVKNPLEELADDIRISAALLDENGKLVGILKTNLSISLNPQGTAGFELTYPELPEDVLGKVKDVKVKAHNWFW